MTAKELREVYEVWSQFKHSVADWFQANAWLIELGVVGIVGLIAVVTLGLLLFAGLLAATSQPTASQGQSSFPPIDEEIKPDGETNSLQPWWTKPFWGVVFAVLFIGWIVACLT